MNLQHIDILDVVFQLIAFMFAISIHESAHAWMANLRGDPTARMLGRITLKQINMLDRIECNPAQHASRRVAAEVGHPGVGRLVNADRKHESDQLEHHVQDVNMLQVHARLVSILTREAVISRAPTVGTVILTKRSPSLHEGLL